MVASTILRGLASCAYRGGLGLEYDSVVVAMLAVGITIAMLLALSI